MNSSEIDIGFAVVLLSPDDIGKLASAASEPTARARQNVIFELGYFVGKLGRGKVAAIKKGDIEQPTDYDGVVYIPFDERGAWQTELITEMKAAGFDIDFNKIIRN